MTNAFTQLIDRFAGRKVLVLGEVMLDSYLEGTTGRLCQEAPVPVVNIHDRRNLAGGAANTAVNLRALSAEPILISVVGDDGEGRLLREVLQTQGVETGSVIVDAQRHTLAKNRVMAHAHLLVRYDQGTTTPIEENIEHQVIERLIALHRECDAIVVSDYSYGILTPRVIGCLSYLQRRRPRVLVVDSKRLCDYARARVTAVKPNFTETLNLLGLPAPVTHESRLELVEAKGEQLREMCAARIAAVTMDIDGALFFDGGPAPYRTYARPQPQAQAAGAGDTFLAALALSLACHADTPTAAEIASAAAAVVVAKEATSVCTSDELLDQLCTPEKFYNSRERLAARCDAYRRQGKRVVLTNGCFDILHTGHVSYLNQAKSLGDVLVVAINSDESVRRLKGPERPINRAEDRLQVLAALSCVDHLIVFDERTPAELITATRPDVFVKGGDYTREALPEAKVVEQYGGVVQILPYVADRSTSTLIQRIREQAASEETLVSQFSQATTDDHDPLADGSQFTVH